MVRILHTASCDSSRHNTMEVQNVEGSVIDLKTIIQELRGMEENDFYLLHNGRKVPENAIITDGIIHVVPRLIGGKGGFGSMLRAIGAQIEKTTNREACRDLSGRRLRDINEEKRLKNWIAQQAEREREAAERKRKKLERLREEPKHKFQDETYEEERSMLTEKVSDAVEQGFKLASTGGVGNGHKRKASSTVTSTMKKKKTMWLDPDEEDLSSSDSDGEDFQPKLPKEEEKQIASDPNKPSTSKGVTRPENDDEKDNVIPLNNTKESLCSDYQASTSKNCV